MFDEQMNECKKGLMFPVPGRSLWVCVFNSVSILFTKCLSRGRVDAGWWWGWWCVCQNVV
jgi:hypothetical protein